MCEKNPLFMMAPIELKKNAPPPWTFASILHVAWFIRCLLGFTAVTARVVVVFFFLLMLPLLH